jgi:cardiolipin synthase
MRRLAEQALSRTSGAPLLEHNQVRILRDADANYPAWLTAIQSATKFVHFENYIFDEDEVGWLFAEALVAKAREGVIVRVVRDWLGTWYQASRSFWRHMTTAGVHVRCFNPPRIDGPIGWITRDHRKMVAVDGSVAFVAGLCISKRWKGNPAHNISPWRDTGVEIRGPAVADVHAAFGQIWETMGDALPVTELPGADSMARAGEVALRVVAGTPTTAGMFRTDQLIAAVARESLWLTDAYFVGITPYVQALLAAARDGVDVRLLIPHATDLRIIRTLSRSGLRPLLEGGVRIFEWNGSMMHAKTAVVDGRWSRIGSSNLNIATFIGNYELDVAIDDVNVAREMERMYVDDLSNATEIILSRNRVFHVALSSPELESQRTQQYYDGLPRSKGSAAAAGAIRVANAVSAAMTNHRILGPAEGGVLLVSGVVLLALAVLGALWPPLLALPIALVALYTGLALVWRAIRVRTRRRPLLPAAARMPPAATTSTVAPVSPPTTDAANGVVHEKISEISEPSKKHAP